MWPFRKKLTTVVNLHFSVQPGPFKETEAVVNYEHCVLTGSDDAPCIEIAGMFQDISVILKPNGHTTKSFLKWSHKSGPPVRFRA